MPQITEFPQITLLPATVLLPQITELPQMTEFPASTLLPHTTELPHMTELPQMTEEPPGWPRVGFEVISIVLLTLRAKGEAALALATSVSEQVGKVGAPAELPGLQL